MEEIRSLRPSRASLAAFCAASAWTDKGEISIDAWNPAGAVGSAFHAVIAGALRGQLITDDAIAKACAQHGVPDSFGEVSFLSWAAWKAWEELHPNVTGEVWIERRLEGSICDVDLSGTLDLMTPIGDVAVVHDWKSTRLRSVTYHMQMMVYMWHVLQLSEFEKVQYKAHYLRDGTHDISRVYTMEEIEGELMDLIHRVKGGQNKYSPHPDCGWCPKAANCEAHQAIQKQFVETFMESNDLTAGNIIDSVMYAKSLIRSLDKGIKSVLASVEAEGDYSDGVFKLTTKTTTRRKVVYETAKPFLLSRFTQKELDPMLEIGKTNLSKAISDKVERGNKGRVIKAAFLELEDAGAITTTTSTSLDVVRMQKQITEGESK